MPFYSLPFKYFVYFNFSFILQIKYEIEKYGSYAIKWNYIESHFKSGIKYKNQKEQVKISLHILWKPNER
jgi:hypothetical protein